jgi:hypothetical protein
MGNKVSLNQIIGNVIGNLRITDTNNIKDDFARWACEAENKIGSEQSYKRHECELVIHNRKAALPPNFIYLHALKYGNRTIDVTKRSFRMFNKGPKLGGEEVVSSGFIGGQVQTCSPGVPLSVDILLGGVFATTDVIVVTFTSNNCGNTATNSFSYIVQNGDTLDSIAESISNQINAINNIGYSSNFGTQRFNVTGDNPDVNFNITLYTDSATGTLSECVVQKRVPPKKDTINVGSSTDNLRLTSNNLADSSVAKSNTGINAQGGGGTINGYGYGYGYDFAPNESVFSIDNGCINFNVRDNERVAISYMGIDLDEEGWPLIAAEHEDAVTHYIMFMHKSVSYYEGKLAQHVHDKLEKRWYWLCGQARGDDEMPNSEELKYLSNRWMQLMPPPTKEIF